MFLRRAKSAHFAQPKLSVVVVFHNMRREARRTLYSLTTDYQRDIDISEYEVIAVDSNSREPLDAAWVESLGPNFRYDYVSSALPTPCEAINHGISMARAEHVACSIDGARILSPGVLSLTLQALKVHPDAFVYTLGMHLGPKRQTLSIEEGYCQHVEDVMLDKANWESDGYGLFSISALAGSCAGGFLQPIRESNFFTVNKSLFQALGCYDARFVCSGGGLVNLDVFKRLLAEPTLKPVMLLGEASFHQFHGGVSTNVPKKDHPLAVFEQEYLSLKGEKYQTPSQHPVYFGNLDERCKPFLDTFSKP